MPRPQGTPEKKPRKPGGGRKPGSKDKQPRKSPVRASKGRVRLSCTVNPETMEAIKACPGPTLGEKIDGLFFP